MIRKVAVVWSVAIVFLLATCVKRAEAQNCQAIMQQLLSGGHDVAWALRAQDYYNRNCLGRQPETPPLPQPSYPTYDLQPAYQAPTFDTLTNTLLQEFSKLGELINKGQPLRQNIPLSNGTKTMDTVAAPPPAPSDYVDPFAARTFPPITQSTAGPVTRRGNIWDPSNWVELSPPPRPSATPEQRLTPAPGPCGPYAPLTGVCSAPITGFGR
jgi:hypothetical protein